MKWTLIALAVAGTLAASVLVAAASITGYSTFKTGLTPADLQEPSLAEGPLPIAKEVYQPVIDKAKVERGRRYREAESSRKWAEGCAIVGGVIAAILGVVSVVFGLNGPTAKQDAPTTNEQMLEQLKQLQAPRLVVAFVGLMIALTSITSFLAQRLQAYEARQQTMAKELDDKLSSTLLILYDPKTSKGVAQSALSQLEGAIDKR